MIVWKYVFLYTTIAMVAGFALTMLWHQWRYRVRNRRRAATCAAQIEIAATKLAAVDRRERKSDEWFAASSSAIANIRKELRSIKA